MPGYVYQGRRSGSEQIGISAVWTLKCFSVENFLEKLFGKKLFLGAILIPVLQTDFYGAVFYGKLSKEDKSN